MNKYTKTLLTAVKTQPAALAPCFSRSFFGFTHSLFLFLLSDCFSSLCAPQALHRSDPTASLIHRRGAGRLCSVNHGSANRVYKTPQPCVGHSTLVPSAFSSTIASEGTRRHQRWNKRAARDSDDEEKRGSIVASSFCFDPFSPYTLDPRFNYFFLFRVRS